MTDNKKSENESISKSDMTKYTFSLPSEFDLNVCGASYAILYKYSQPIDTVLLYSSAFFIGTDSILYLQVRSQKGTEEHSHKSKNNKIFGRVKGLTIYDGNKFSYLSPPLYDSFFSAFYLDNYVLYYWGWSKDSTYACKYNIINKKFKKVYLTDLNWGTDYIGTFDRPELYYNSIEFSSSITKRSWTLNFAFDKVIECKVYRNDTAKVKDSTEFVIIPYVH